MTGDEFKRLRESEGLALSRASLAALLHVSQRTIERYEATTSDIPWLTAFVMRFCAENPVSLFSDRFLNPGGLRWHFEVYPNSEKGD